jgi:hypothetical protein
MEQIDANKCFVSWCGEPLKVKGLCRQHYQEHRNKDAFHEHIRMFDLHATYFTPPMSRNAYKKRVVGIVSDLPIKRNQKSHFVEVMMKRYPVAKRKTR